MKNRPASSWPSWSSKPSVNEFPRRRMCTPPLAAHRGGEPGVGGGSARSLAGDLERALRRSLAAPDLVAAGIEVEGEAARQSLGEVLLLAEDAVALEDLELRRLVRAVVGGVEPRRAGP